MADAVPPSLAVSKTDNALVNLRSRALDLHARLLELRDAVIMLRDGVGPARNAPWSSFLVSYETLSKLFFQLTEELDRAVTDVGFQNFLLQPKALGEDPDLVPNLLRTMLEPEVEKDLHALHAECIADMGGTTPTSQDLEKRILLFNAFVSGATERYDELRDELLDLPRPPEHLALDTPPAAQALLSALATGSPIP